MRSRRWRRPLGFNSVGSETDKKSDRVSWVRHFARRIRIQLPSLNGNGISTKWTPYCEQDGFILQSKLNTNIIFSQAETLSLYAARNTHYVEMNTILTLVNAASSQFLVMKHAASIYRSFTSPTLAQSIYDSSQEYSSS